MTNYYAILIRINSKPWELRCTLPNDCKLMNVQIYFSHDDIYEDATEFSIEAWSGIQLARLFTDFCNENNFKNVHIDTVYVTQAVETWRELI